MYFHDLFPGDKAVIALVHPVVTVQKTSTCNKKMKKESISLVGDPAKTWVKVLPRRDLTERFFVLERTANTGQTKYIIANRDRIEPWLKYLVKNHPEYARRIESGELAISEEVLAYLQDRHELASVDSARVEDSMVPDAAVEYGMIQPEVESGFSDHHVMSFDRFPHLYLKDKEMVRIRKDGKLEIVADDSERRPTYHASANLAFPHLFPHGETPPTDFNYVVAKDLLAWQTMFAYTDSTG